MNRFGNFVFTSIVCALSVFGAGGVQAEDNPNAAVVTKVQLKSSEARLTFKITIADPAQPVLLEVDALNTVGAVIASISPSPALMYYQVTGTEGDTGKQDQIQLKLPKAGVYEFSLVDATSFSIKPQYVVIASLSADSTPVLTTRVHSNLVVFLKKNFVHSIDDAIVNFNDGGIDRQIDVKSQPFIKDWFSIHPDPSGIEVKQNLAFLLTKDSDLDVNGTAFATLQFPMAGNWPPQWTTLAGSIGFVYPGISNLPMVPESAFAATIVKPTHAFTNQLQITRKSNLVLDANSNSSWPEQRYIDERRYCTTKGAVAYVNTGGKTPTSVPGKDSKPHSLQFYVHPEQGNSAYMSKLLAVLAKLPHDAEPLCSVHERLVKELPDLKKCESSISELFNHHNYLVQTGESAEVVANSRKELESAKRAADAIVESYNALVKSFTH